MKTMITVVIIFAALATLLIALNVLKFRKKGTGSASELLRKISENFLIILLVIAGVVVSYFGVYSPLWKTPRLNEVGSWGQNHWLWILILWGIIAAIVARIAGGAAKTLQAVLAITMFMLFIGFPVIVWVENSGSSGKISRHTVPRRTSIPLASEPVSTWPKIVLQPGGRSKLIPIPLGMHVIVDGNNFLLHTVFLDGHEVIRSSEKPNQLPLTSDRLIGAYVTNKAKETNIVSYAYAPM